MSKILAVVGATGHQGGSIISHVLTDPNLSNEYKVRAITRDVQSDKTKQLTQNNVEVVAGDANAPDTLGTAFEGVHTVFIMTMPLFSPDGFEVEFNAGKAMADVAVQKGAKYLIFSTLPSVQKLSNGKYTKVAHFDAKAKVEDYIRGLPVQSAFVAPGLFMQNFQIIPFMIPQKATDDTWTLTLNNSPATKMPMLDAAGDLGKYVSAILAEPDKYQGKTFCAATAMYSWEDMAAITSKATGKNVTYKQVSNEEFKNSLPFAADNFTEAFGYPEEFGYYGSDTEKLVAWANENVQGKPSTFEEYVEANPPSVSLNRHYERN